MSRDEVKVHFGSLTVVACGLGVSPQAVSQWFDRSGCFIGDDVRKYAVIGFSAFLGKDVPLNWFSCD